ncbi:helix-turn-helix domain-containing protein [Legionella bozemanae]|uniref:HTH-type transcriptional regulator n=1 Tax=Legionella bozemanae TaxID=447 RepID=A0A0W0R9T4_LEGBO|nr:S24 family peptidase [Legionella bozemanae]KTC67826.1 HTH-type transcriptional regulator [Legionella bozemanae]STP14021.1 Uncharacterized HTH-type transcriptional regulator CBU_1416 [Legionella bozemanae]
MTVDCINISNVLSRLLKSHNMSESEFSRQSNIPRITISRLINRRTPDPRSSTLEAIAKFFNISLDQLLGKKPLNLHSDTKKIDDISYIPILEWQDSSNWIDKYNNYLSSGRVVFVSGKKDSLFALKTSGDAMWPNFPENTILIIDPIKEVKNKSFVLAYIEKEKEILFRQIFIEGSYKILRAINSIFPPIQIENNDQIIGVIIETRHCYD